MSDETDVLLAAALRAKAEKRFEAALESLVRTIALLRQDGASAALANALRILGEVERSIPASDGGVGSYDEAVAILRGEDAPLELAHAVRHLGDIYRHSGEDDRAERCYDEALRLYRAHPEAVALDVANALRGAALLKERMGAHAEAIALWRDARELYAQANIEVAVTESSRRIDALSGRSELG